MVYVKAPLLFCVFGACIGLLLFAGCWGYWKLWSPVALVRMQELVSMMLVPSTITGLASMVFTNLIRKLNPKSSGLREFQLVSLVCGTILFATLKRFGLFSLPVDCFGNNTFLEATALGGLPSLAAAMLFGRTLLRPHMVCETAKSAQ